MRSIFTAAILMTALVPVFPANAESAETSVTKVLYLKDFETKEAITLLRSEVQVRRIAELRGRDLVIVGGSAERVERSEALLRERGALDRSVEPHEPFDVLARDEPPLETRTFRMNDFDPKAAVVILRSLYVIRQIDLGDDGESVVVTAAPIRLDMVEALLKELGALD